MSAAVFLIRLLLAAIFAVAGAAKLRDYKGSSKSLVNFGLPQVLAGPLGILLPVAELICALALLPDRFALWGAYGIAALLGMFIVGMTVVLAQGRTPDCHCFGQLHSSPVSVQIVLRNIVLLALAGFLVWQDRRHAGADAWSSLGDQAHSPSALMAITAVLAILVALLLWAFVNVLRQNGRMLLRIEAIEAKLSIDVDAVPPQGLPVGTPAPGFSLQTLDGDVVTFAKLQESGKPLLLVFSGPDCGACDALYPQLAKWQIELRDRITMVLISKGDAEINRAKTTQSGLRDVLLQIRGEVSSSYLVNGTPSAVLVEDGAVASTLAEGESAIRDLVNRATLPPRVGKGDPMPALRLRDLQGASVDLSGFQNRKTIVLFWNPTCGFCEKILGDLKEWERSRPASAPELIVISSGSAASNRAQGFRSTVLLDPDFRAGSALGSAGTPSAFIVDESGKIATGVSAGGPDVLTLIDSVHRPVLR